MRLAYLALAFVAGCAQPQIYPACQSQRVLYVVSHGWHTGIVVGRSDLVKLVPALITDMGSDEYLEIGWGDEDYFQAEKGTVGLALRALFASKSSALQIVRFSGSPHAQFPGSKIAEVRVDEAGYRAVLDFVTGSFLRSPDGRIVGLGPSQYGQGRFYRAAGSFGAFNNCNTWVAKAMEKTGYPVSASTFTARGLFSQLPRADCR